MRDCKEMTCFSFFPLKVMLTLVDGRMEDIPVSEMGDKYGSFRIVNPRADEVMLQSMQRYGQLTPVVCTKGEGYELIDGFKRLRPAAVSGGRRSRLESWRPPSGSARPPSSC